MILVLGAMVMASRGSLQLLARSCAPTHADVLGPYYKPGAPVRSQVGSGHVLKGTVRAASDCAPVAGALIEVWLTGADGRYTDDRRATVLSDADGHWKIEVMHASGHYFAKVPAEKVMHTHCGGAKSRSVDVM